MSDSQQPLLSFENFSLQFRRRQTLLPVVDQLSLSIYPGQTLGIVGESGCGKSVTALSVLQLLPSSLAVYSGKILFQGRNLLELSAQEITHIRGHKISMIFQDPLSSLNPSLRVGYQLTEGLIIHQQMNADKARKEALSLLERVHIPSPDRCMRAYPHELSGGMRQRVMIAMALALKPALLIADEPTTALDLTTQAQILHLIQQLQRELGMSMLFITHDLSLIATLCDQVAVFYSGRMVEQADVETFFDHAAHPYSQGLLSSRLKDNITLTTPLPLVPGQVTPIEEWVQGCRFAPRCPHAFDICHSTTPPPLSALPSSSPSPSSSSSSPSSQFHQQCACYLYPSS